MVINYFEIENAEIEISNENDRTKLKIQFPNIIWSLIFVPIGPPCYRFVFVLI